MAKINAFKGFRPGKDKVNVVASRPYDVMNSSEAREEVKGNPWSFLHVVKPEVDLPEGTDLYSDQVYNKGKENLEKLITEGYFVQDESERLYIYAQTMFGRTQYGIVACASVDDYLDWCKERNKEPEKSFSGKFVLRLSPDLHRKLNLKARMSNTSLNSFIVQTLEKAAAS